MRYQWNADQMGDLLGIPAAVADKHLKLASELSLKVLLWLARFGKGEFDAAACAEAVGASREDCEDAFCYWSEAGVLRVCRRKGAEPVAEKSAPVPEATPLPAAPRPRAVKPQMKEVISRQKSSRAFAGLLEAASARLGKPIGNGDMETLLYLFDTAGLPAEVILMVIVYCKSIDKANMRYIETVALDWADRGINTVPLAEAYLCEADRLTRVEARLTALITPEQKLRKADVKTADRWFTEWKMSDELIAEAVRLCRENKEKFSAPYTNAILERWHADGITAVADIPAPTKKKARGAVKDSSLEVGEYEDMVRNFIPDYQKMKKRGGKTDGVQS